MGDRDLLFVPMLSISLSFELLDEAVAAANEDSSAAEDCVLSVKEDLGISWLVLGCIDTSGDFGSDLDDLLRFVAEGLFGSNTTLV